MSLEPSKKPTLFEEVLLILMSFNRYFGEDKPPFDLCRNQSQAVQVAIRPKARSQTSFESCFLVAAWKNADKGTRNSRWCDVGC